MLAVTARLRWPTCSPIRAQGIGGVPREEFEERAGTLGVSSDLLRRALPLYVHRAGRTYLTQRGWSFLGAASAEPLRVSVLPHAIDRAMQRRLIDVVDRREAEALIESEVRDGLTRGRHSRQRPAWLRLYGNTRKPQPGKETYVWNEHETHAWVVVRDATGCAVLTGLKNGTIAGDAMAQRSAA